MKQFTKEMKNAIDIKNNDESGKYSSIKIAKYWSRWDLKACGELVTYRGKRWGNNDLYEGLYNINGLSGYKTYDEFAEYFKDKTFVIDEITVVNGWIDDYSELTTVFYGNSVELEEQYPEFVKNQRG